MATFTLGVAFIQRTARAPADKEAGVAALASKVCLNAAMTEVSFVVANVGKLEQAADQYRIALSLLSHSGKCREIGILGGLSSTEEEDGITIVKVRVATISLILETCEGILIEINQLGTKRRGVNLQVDFDKELTEEFATDPKSFLERHHLQPPLHTSDRVPRFRFVVQRPPAGATGACLLVPHAVRGRIVLTLPYEAYAASRLLLPMPLPEAGHPVVVCTATLSGCTIGGRVSAHFVELVHANAPQPEVDAAQSRAGDWDDEEQPSMPPVAHPSSEQHRRHQLQKQREQVQRLGCQVIFDRGDHLPTSDADVQAYCWTLASVAGATVFLQRHAVPYRPISCEARRI